MLNFGATQMKWGSEIPNGSGFCYLIFSVSCWFRDTSRFSAKKTENCLVAFTTSWVLSLVHQQTISKQHICFQTFIHEVNANTNIHNLFSCLLWPSNHLYKTWTVVMRLLMYHFILGVFHIYYTTLMSIATAAIFHSNSCHFQ